MQEVGSVPEGIGVIAPPGGVGDPSVGHATVPTQHREPVLHMAVSAFGLLHGLKQAWIGHAVEDVSEDWGWSSSRTSMICWSNWARHCRFGALVLWGRPINLTHHLRFVVLPSRN